MRGREILLAAIVAAGSLPAAAQANSEPIVLRLRAPDGCPDEAALRASIERLLGGPPKPTNRPLSADARIDAGGEQGWRLELVLASGASRTTRTLHGSSCATLAEAGALLIALAFDPDAVAEQEAKQEAPAEPPPHGPGGEPVSPPDAPPALPTPQPTEAVVRIPVPLPPAVMPVQPPAAKARAVVPPARPKPGFQLGPLAGLTVDIGSLPSAAPGLRTGIAIELGAYRIEPFFELWPSSQAALADRPSRGARIRLWVGALRGCRQVLPWSKGDGLLTLSACIGFEMGEMRGTGFGVAVPRDDTALWAAPRAELRAGLEILGPITFTADLGLAVPLDPRRFVLELSSRRAAVHEPAGAALRVALGLAAHF